MNGTLPAEALARVLDAVEASTAAATKKAYRSDWDRFAGWAGRRRFPPLPAPPAVLAHYVTEAAARADRRREVAVRPGDADPVGGLDQPGAHRRRPRPARPQRGGPPRPVRDPPHPGHPTEPARARCCWPTSAPC